MRGSLNSLLILIFGQLFAENALAQSFQKEYLGCVPNQGGPNCPKHWRFSDGPGYVGQRVGADTKIFCSPSCEASSSNPKICSLIVVLHGIYMDPGSMEWLLLGDHSGQDAYSESEENGGPFCVSIHKSEGDPWDYSCDRNDADHIAGFIPWALEEFPINPEAVFLHGFSSGAIMTSNLMFGSCRIESMIAGAAPYAGLVNAAPTTKAAFLVIHGTHDNVVPFREDYINSVSTPSCECNGLVGGQSSCFYDDNYIDIKGPTMAASIAKLRGYNGDVFDNYPSVSETLNLVDISQDQCQINLNNCISPWEWPNPFNAGYDCTEDLNTDETDVIYFPTTEENTGPVVLWRINLHNHDYPNVRRTTYGPTEFFFQLKKFFYNNRGRFSSFDRYVQQVATDVACSDPVDFFGATPLAKFFRNDVFPSDNSMTPQLCSEYCENDYRCTDAFYVDLRGYAYYKGCKVYYDPYPCLSTNGIFGLDLVHFKSGDPKPSPFQPTPAPTLTPAPTPTPEPSTASPTPVPTSPPTTFCAAEEDLVPSNTAGYSCLVGVIPIGDSNFDFLESDCDDVGGTWSVYDCSTALSYWLTLPPEARPPFTDAWEPFCCGSDPPSPPTTFCEKEEDLVPSTTAGYACLVDGVSIGDSNFDYLESDCDNDGGTWTVYDCSIALSYWLTLPPGDQPFFTDAWAPVCCSDVTAEPTMAPTSLPTTAPTTAPTTSEPTTAPTTSEPTTAPTTSEPTTAPTTSEPTAAPTISPTSLPTEDCSAFGRRKACINTVGCTWERDDQGVGFCQPGLFCPGKRKPCKETDGCFWQSNGDGTGRCKRCSSISKKNNCELQVDICEWIDGACV